MKKSTSCRITLVLLLALCIAAVEGSYAQKKPARRTTQQQAPQRNPSTRQPLPVSESSIEGNDTTGGRPTQPLPTPLPAFNDSLHLLDTLRSIRQRIERLQGVLDKVTFGPQSYYFTRLRSWSIPLSDALNDSISRYFFEVLENDSSFIESRGDIQVIATPEPSTDLVAMYFNGNGKDRKGQRLREVLEKKKERNMYRQILESREYSEDKELIDRKFKIVNLNVPHLIKEADSVLVPFTRYSYTSVDHRDATVLTIRVPDNLSIRFGHMWGLEGKIGNDELGLPFWHSGNMSVFILYNQIKVGAQIPFKWGTDPNFVLSSVWKTRTLDGTYGVTGEFDWAYAGGFFLVGFQRRDFDGTFARPDTLYSLRTAGQVWYSFTMSTNNNANLFRFKAGLGIEVLGSSLRDTVTQTIEPIENRPFWSPYFKFDYMNQQFARRFGISGQYFRDIALLNLWLEIIPEQLRVEAKFSTLLLRERDPWEPPYFFTLSIPYTFSL